MDGWFVTFCGENGVGCNLPLPEEKEAENAGVQDACHASFMA
ncbi:MAG: hypothetical protein PUD91_08725 [Bacteroidales bacterium]|nr:hypothetical protein [Bacteroidales bacterium]